MSEAQSLDSYWSAVILFLDENADLLPATAAPDGLKVHRPDLIGFSELEEIEGIRQIVCHKGLIEQLPVGLLAASFGRATVVFANEVFVVFKLAVSDIDHVRAFQIDLGRHLSDPDASTAQQSSSRLPVTVPLLHSGPAPQRRSSSRRVVAAVQSPTLLNIWATSNNWKLEVAKLGDHDGLSETALLDVASWDGREKDVAAVLVTSPLQLERAQEEFPDSAYIWIIHNGRAGLLPPELISKIDGIIALSRKVLAFQRTHHPALMGKPAWVIAPSYTAKNDYLWTENLSWTMKSRPHTRDRYVMALMDQSLEMLSQQSVYTAVYGQDAPDGFLDLPAKLDLQSRCSCYVSSLPPWAGFGLAEHECMAAGVPIAALMWGDLAEEISPGYSSLTYSIGDLVQATIDLCRNKLAACRISQLGLDYIASYRTFASMNEEISKFVDEVTLVKRG